MDISLSQRIKKYIESKKITQEAFGKPLGVGKSSVGQWVNGLTEPSAAKKILILQEYPDINPRWFLFGTGSMTGEIEYQSDEDEFANMVKEDSPIYKFIAKQYDDVDRTLRELIEAKDGLILMQKKLIDSLERELEDKNNNMYSQKEVDEKVRNAVELALEKERHK